MPTSKVSRGGVDNNSSLSSQEIQKKFGRGSNGRGSNQGRGSRWTNNLINQYFL